MENIAQNIITKCGGPRVVAGWLGLSVPTVYRWTYEKERGGSGGLIPSEHQAPIMWAANAAGVNISPYDFFPSAPVTLQTGSGGTTPAGCHTAPPGDSHAKE